MQVRVTVQQELPLGWTKTFSSGLLIPTTVQNFQTYGKSLNIIRDIHRGRS